MASLGPDRTEIADEMARLLSMQPQVRQFSPYGDDNHVAILAQVEVLKDRMDEDEVFEYFECSPANVMSSARDAADWLAGDSQDLPSDDWKSMIV